MNTICLLWIIGYTSIVKSSEDEKLKLDFEIVVFHLYLNVSIAYVNRY